jgi:hypothetical protein
MIYGIAASILIFTFLVIFGLHAGTAFFLSAACFAGWAAFDWLRSKPPSP